MRAARVTISQSNAAHKNRWLSGNKDTRRLRFYLCQRRAAQTTDRIGNPDVRRARRERRAAWSIRRGKDASRHRSGLQSHAGWHQNSLRERRGFDASAIRRASTGPAQRVYPPRDPNAEDPHHRRTRLSATLTRRIESFLPSHRATIRTWIGHHHQQPSVRTMGQCVCRRRHHDCSDARPATPSRPCRDDQR